MVETDEKDNNSEQTQEVESKETDKMLNNKEAVDLKKDLKKVENVEKKEIEETVKTEEKQPVVNGEEIAKAPDSTTKVTAQEREVKPKKIPIGGIKMPGFFTRNKPKTEGDGADGELLEKGVNDVKETEEKIEEKIEEKPKEEKPKATSFLSSLRIRNPFKRQPTPQKDGEEAKETKSDEITEEVKPTTDESIDTPTTPQKNKFINAIRTPLANLIPKRMKSGGGNDDIELGNGPNNKANLASMETLDDSLKDVDTKDTTDSAIGAEIDCKKGDDGLENVKLDNGEEKPQEPEPTKKQPIIERIRGYRCNKDDLFILGGIIAFVFLVAIILAFALSGKKEINSAPVRDGRYIEAVTSCGLVEGMLEDGAFAFRGIPYATPPIGENRWRQAQLIDNIDNCWNGTYKAHNATLSCWQIYDDSKIDGKEDCLTLDVVTPHVRYDNPLPVVVLIGTESLTGGSPGILRPSTRYARSRDVIFVRPNFRIGVFGFLSLDTLSKASHPISSGNYGLSDIIAALKWIQLNIAHFGGDPKSVTLFGHRAGGTLVSALVTSPKAKDLYARAWVSSSSANFPGKPLSEYERANQEILDRAKCSDSECLRNVEDEDLIDVVPDEWRQSAADLPGRDENTTSRHEWLILDGDILQKHPQDVWNRETGPPKMVIGTTAHESHSAKLFEKHIWTPESIKQYIEDSKIGQLGLTEEVLKMYNATYQGLVSMISDIRTICPLLAIARLQPSVPFYVVTQTGGPLNLADVDTDVQAILGRYEPKTPEQRRYVSAIQQLFYHYVSHGEMKQFEVRRRVFDIGQDALSQEDYPNCDYWIKKDIVPRYARLD